MSDTKFPDDKELCKQIQPEPAVEEISVTQPALLPSTKRLVFLLSLLWVFWSVAVITDTLLSLEVAMVSFRRMTPLQSHIFWYQWDKWLYYHDPTGLLQGPALPKIFLASMTLCAMLIMALANILHNTQDGMGLVITHLTVTVFLVAAGYVGAAEHEASIIAMPFGWLCATTALLILYRAGMTDLGKVMGVSARVTKWAAWGSISAFGATHFWLYSFGNELVTVFLLWQGITAVYKWLG